MGCPEIVLTHIEATELMVYEMALSQSHSASGQLDHLRIRYLQACVQSIRAWFDIFFTIPPSEYIGFSFATASQLARCLGLLQSISALDDPGWSKEEVRATVDVLEILERVASNMEQVHMLAGIDNTGCPDGDIFQQTGRRFRTHLSAWAAKLGRAGGIGEASGQPAAEGEDIRPLETLDLDWLDNDWLMDSFMVPGP